MIVFQVLNFDPATEILKIRCHIYLYFNENSDYSEENTCENEVFCSTQKETKHIHASATYLLHTVLEQDARCSHCRCFAKKRFSQNSQETPVPEETPVNFAKFLRTPFLQNNSGRLQYCNNDARDIYCICCREPDAMLIALAKIPEHEGRISPSSFFGHLPDYQSHVLVLSTLQMSSSFGSWCS